MKGSLKALAIGTALVAMAGCSSTVTYENQTSYQIPKWYNDCDQFETDQYWKLWWSEENLVGCGSSADGFEEHSYSTAIMNAKAKIADRVNGVVSSNSELVYSSDSKTNTLSRSNRIEPSNLNDYEITEKFTYPYQGKFVTFVKIKVPRNNIMVRTNALPN